jgi:hypothetical protein
LKIAKKALGVDGPLPMAQWFYGENGQQQGPVEDDAFGALIASQRISPTTLVWREGMPAWLPFHQAQASGLLMQPQMMNPAMMNPTTSSLAIASLVCGIAGLVSCIVILGIPAIILGHMAISQIAKSPIPMVGRGMAIAGLVCGYVTTLMLLGFVAMILIPIFSGQFF